MAQARCPHCGKWFEPTPGKGMRQKTCGEPECRRLHKKILGQQWRAENPERSLGRQGKVRAWADAGDYWRGWRDKHAGYVERNREQTRERMKRRRDEAHRSQALLKDPVGYLRGLREDVCKTGLGEAVPPRRNTSTVEGVCNTGLGVNAFMGVVDYLLARELSSPSPVSEPSKAVSAQ